ncbi:hypothetical protein HRR90_003637 [Exophiala dermatitidis]|uniref:RING-type domain-containing protein n=2 Tax=Exophiala dermatitidis TaxID=5970 RepID=H6BMC6_EXODN|nr:uncharacterized protein HMPREF1120_01208 [Exophiala dermatitidis NIH/UT8656]KAJ4512187.1 hypothetical protein HRR75_005087 [Exophiala dermatitidis]EHY53007.1 hypothetical protein HMPREF1120_01208 [Exophiala dermatitidis NIH/UT8656]KAJ4515086.1 hypothetical protein HRR74_005551 [Exophiala dermatitidis]KAJ4548662.1 hypothetical protein HRR76_001251 [Exophiala dermatitidis]KAJ4550474.1 hypothetical protein HRR78_004243 [Exophiala dermatitidis]
MSSNSVSSQPQPSQQPGLPVLSSFSSSSPAQLRELQSLKIEAENLRANQAHLERELETIRLQIAAKDSAILAKMKELEEQASRDEITERQSAFKATVLDNVALIEALRRKCHENANLKTALDNIVMNRATFDDNSQFGAALLTELSGDVLPFLHEVAARVLEADNVNTNVLDPEITAPVVDIDSASEVDDQADRSFTPPRRSPSIKSESSSTQAFPSIPQDAEQEPYLNTTETMSPTSSYPEPPVAQGQGQASFEPYTLLQDQLLPQTLVQTPPLVQTPSLVQTPPLLQTRTQTPVANLNPVARRVTPAPGFGQAASPEPRTMYASQTRFSLKPNPPMRPAASSPEPNQAGISRLQRDFPGLLDSLRMSEQAQPSPPPSKRRARDSVDTDMSGNRSSTPGGSGGVKPPAKKQKLDKEPAYMPTFGIFMKQLETEHRQGNSIEEMITCSRCEQIKPKCRILNCLHLYCHKCVLALRADAEKGNPVTGFRAFCVKQGCNVEVSGKTSVVEPEAMAFLKWYNEQPANLTATVAQKHVLETALEDFPEDDEIERKLDHVNAKVDQLNATGQPDKLCDLVHCVKLARKPY